MDSSGAVPFDAEEIVKNKIWYGLIWAVKITGESTHTSYWNSEVEADARYKNMVRDKSSSTVYSPVQVPVLYVFVNNEVKIAPLLEIGL